MSSLRQHLTDSHDATDVARLVAEHRDTWASHVRFDPDSAHHVTLVEDDRWVVTLDAWLPGQSAHVHEHVGGPGALLVLQGTLAETTWHVATDGPQPGRRHGVTRTYGPHEVRSHSAVHVHETSVAGPDPVVALHVRRRVTPPRHPGRA